MLQYNAYRLALWLISRLGRHRAWALGGFLTDIMSFFKAKDLQALTENYEALKAMGAENLPQTPRAYAKAVYRSFVRYFVDLFALGRLLNAENLENYVQFEGLEHLNQALEKGQGVIALTAHYGHWEIGGFALGLKGFPISAVALSHKDQRVNQLFDGLRTGKGLKVIALGQASRECLKVLKQGQLLGLVGDRIFSRREKPISVPFLGRKMNVPSGPRFLAKNTDAALVPIFVHMLEDGRYKVKIEKALSSQEGDSCAEQFAKRFEQAVLENPCQWFCFQKVLAE